MLQNGPTKIRALTKSDLDVPVEQESVDNGAELT